MSTTTAFSEVHLRPLSYRRFSEVMPADRYAAFESMVREAVEKLDGRTIWNFNSTAAGGGVAELLTGLIAYARDAGVDARWLVVRAGPAFFDLTKRIHNNLHGSPGDGGALGAAEHAVYEESLAASTAQIGDMVRPGDVVLLHDPQTAGLVGAARRAGAGVIWRCHVGIDEPHPLAQRAWDFLGAYLQDAQAWVMSRPAFAWQGWDARRMHFIPPSIDAFATKNLDIDEATVAAVLETAGVVRLRGEPDGRPLDVPVSGTTISVRHRAQVIEEEPVGPDDDIVLQVSRWDRLKDPIGVIEGFVDHGAAHNGAHLVLAGPQAVADDPESAVVLAECSSRWADLPAAVRRRVHLVSLSMEDVEENALVVNALQRRATVVVQKSLAEGFGLTVAEAMWKRRPVVATRVGGIQDQIDDVDCGVLVDDPRDLRGYGEAVAALLADPERRRGMGERARLRVIDGFLATRHLTQLAEIAVQVAPPRA